MRQRQAQALRPVLAAHEERRVLLVEPGPVQPQPDRAAPVLPEVGGVSPGSAPATASSGHFRLQSPVRAWPRTSANRARPGARPRAPATVPGDRSRPAARRGAWSRRGGTRPMRQSASQAWSRAIPVQRFVEWPSPPRQRRSRPRSAASCPGILRPANGSSKLTRGPADRLARVRLNALAPSAVSRASAALASTDTRPFSVTDLRQRSFAPVRATQAATGRSSSENSRSPNAGIRTVSVSEASLTFPSRQSPRSRSRRKL